MAGEKNLWDAFWRGSSNREIEEFLEVQDVDDISRQTRQNIVNHAYEYEGKSRAESLKRLFRL